jgi:hypothetical protein
MCECRAGIGEQCYTGYPNVPCVRSVRQRRANVAAIKYDGANIITAYSAEF